MTGSYSMKTLLNSSVAAKYPGLISLLGMLGLIFYAVSPALFPDVSIRQPELLPVYTLMIGLGQLFKKGDTDDVDQKPTEDK